MAKILIAEDDRINQKLVTKLVEELGHIAVVSPNGRHALETLQCDANEFDLMLTDVLMPEMDGRELITALREIPRFADFPIIVMSAVVGIKEISSLLESGASLFLAKPLHRVELDNYIDQCLGTSELEARLA